MNKEQDIDNQLYKYLSPDLYCYVHNYIFNLKMQITQLTNNWNELEEYLQNGINNAEKTGFITTSIIIKIVLDKMEEIKGDKE